jgi:5-methylthioadenosine/S-adenosylhomocysteine deaminase
MTTASGPGGSEQAAGPAAAELTPGRPLVFRNATVLTMDDGHRVLDGADVLVDGERIAAVGPALEVPAGTAEIDASGGIVMPGMIASPAAMTCSACRWRST